MILEPQLTFRHLDPSPALIADVHRRLAWLDRFHPRIIGVHVVVEAPHQHSRTGMPVRCRVDIRVPGAHLVVGRDPPADRSHADAFVAVRDAFHAARRELMDNLRVVRRDVKAHEPVPIGRVVRLFDEPGGRYGFVETDEGNEVYFHEHAVLDGWDALEVGARVRFVEEHGDKGRQASTVELTGHSPPV